MECILGFAPLALDCQHGYMFRPTSGLSLWGREDEKVCYDECAFRGQCQTNIKPLNPTQNH
jgi:hypothetical protein